MKVLIGRPLAMNITKEILQEKYFKMTSTEIAKEYKVEKTTVLRMLTRFGISKRKKGNPNFSWRKTITNKSEVHEL